jgi:nickel-dependent lactate racemase
MLKRSYDMKVDLKYGRNGLTVEVPDHAQIIRSKYIPGKEDEARAILEAIRNPIGAPKLSDLVESGQTVCIVHTDITRATPNERLLPVIIQELEGAGIVPKNIRLLNGLGMHRRQSDAELCQMLGENIVDQYTCLQHDAYNVEDLVDLGFTSHGNPVRVNRNYLESDIRILTGFIEPHLFAGFSGGPKAILPSLAGYESVSSNHSALNIAHPSATWGITRGNPIWEEMLEVALMTRPTFLVNVSLNADNQIIGVFAGDMEAAHQTGCRFVKTNSMIPVEKPYDIVVTTNSGYPLDQNLYQSLKGMSAASRIVKKGGAILSVVACEDGIPDHGSYLDLLSRGGSPEGLLEMVHTPGFQEQDQWQVQIQAMIQKKAEVYVFSEGLTDEQIRQALYLPCRDIAGTIAELGARYGKHPSIGVMPEGPISVPYLINP